MLSIKYRNTKDLIPYGNNSRTHSEAQLQKIKNSIEEYGFTNPILIDDKGGVIAGHGRLQAAQMLELEKVPTIVLSGLTDTQKKSYVIADNRIALDGGWSEKLLMKELLELRADSYDLINTGFEVNELAKLLGEEDPNIAGQVLFSENMGESHNYVVVYFDNDLDWLSAQTHFGLKSVTSKRANGKPWSKGIGRVINGSDYLASIK